MDLPDKSQWDETTCDLAVCQHPQCWATIRRIERGHPRLLDSSSKSLLDTEGELASPVSSLTKSLNCFYLAPLCHVVCFLLVWSGLSDKLPVLTIVNIADSCLPAKRVIRRHHLPGFTFTKAHTLLSSKFDSKFQGR